MDIVVNIIVRGHGIIWCRMQGSIKRVWVWISMCICKKRRGHDVAELYSMYILYKWLNRTIYVCLLTNFFLTLLMSVCDVPIHSSQVNACSCSCSCSCFQAVSTLVFTARIGKHFVFCLFACLFVRDSYLGRIEAVRYPASLITLLYRNDRCCSFHSLWL